MAGLVRNMCMAFLIFLPRWGPPVRERDELPASLPSTIYHGMGGTRGDGGLSSMGLSFPCLFWVSLAYRLQSAFVPREKPLGAPGISYGQAKVSL
jgi:hypothetical protein